MKSEKTRQILIVGTDKELLHTRSLILRRSSARVITRTPEKARLILQRQFFDVIVLCHTLAATDVSRMCKGIDLFWPSTSLVIMLESENSEVPHGCAGFPFPWQLGPERLLQLVTTLQSHTMRVA